MSERLIDISPLVSARLAVWPGDVAYRRDVALSIAKGDNIDLSSVKSTLHLGAHADAENHYKGGGAGIEARDLAAYYGPCEVVEVALPLGARIGPEMLPARLQAPRVLFKTGSYPDPERFNTDFNSLSPELVDELADRSVRLVGIDTPSVDPYADAELLSHQALARRGLANLEGLVLADVHPGTYTLIAFPLRLEGADASPVRAVLAPD